MEHLKWFFKYYISSNQLYVNIKKYSFGQQKIEYLGHIISGARAEADPLKIEAMVKWPAPTSLRDLRGFLGLTCYYRIFVKGYRHIAGPLLKLLKKNCFK